MVSGGPLPCCKNLQIRGLLQSTVLFELASLEAVWLSIARTYLQLPLRQWGAGNVYLLVLSSQKLNIAENPIAVMEL